MKAGGRKLTSVSEYDLNISSFFEDLIYKDENELPVFRLFIDGEWQDGKGERIEVITPFDGGHFAYLSTASLNQAGHAVDAAKENQKMIRELAGIERVEILQEARHILLEREEEMARALMLEGGKTRDDAIGEIHSLASRMSLTMEDARKIFGEYMPGDWSKDTSKKMALVIREPVGVVLAIGPFNYPLYIPGSKIIPALLAGNSVIVKPATETPISTILFTQILNAAGVPKGTVSVINGPGSTVGKALASNQYVSMISFTGSTGGGNSIVSVAGIKKLHLELGGKAYAIVLGDADIDLAAKKIVDGSFRNAGQRCDAISAVLTVKKVSKQLTERILNYGKEYRLGDPLKDDGVKVGPLVNEDAAVRVKALIEDALKKGASLLMGGKVRDCYVEPTILGNVPVSARILWEETFGPVIPIHAVKDREEAIAVSLQSRYGLDSCIFSNNFYDIWRVSKSLSVGEVTVNDMPRHGIGYFPFGGTRSSGTGREGVGFSIDEMTNLKTIVFNLEPGAMGKKVF
ncbi:MAG: aldehyde dehydrogenase family protein [Nitrososphaerota archaeon]|nr:aldehyde dehydrogenase family protein [Nitrososphaerota archaeon]